MATNFNRFVKVTFDRPIHFINIENEYKAFTILQQKRDSYQQALYTHTSQAISVSYAQNSNNEPVTNTIIVKFSETDNFRKAEGEVTLHYDSTNSTLFGQYPKDRLLDFDLSFTPVNIDKYQNPDCVEYVKPEVRKNIRYSITQLKKINVQLNIENVSVSVINNSTYTLTILNTIKP